MTQENTPSLWSDKIPRKVGASHKYDYGHVVIYGAPELTGATRLAAEGCARTGAGLVTVLAPPGVGEIYRETLRPHILVRDDLDWDDERVTVKLYGSGGVSKTPDYSSILPTVLDADALNDLPGTLGGHFVLTPHEGEFARVFPDLKGSREERAVAAARKSGAVIVLKGEQTVIAAPDGRVVINTHASPYLASAGTGDVLAGMIAGFIGQGMEPFDAACAAVWIHGECGVRIGSGLVASDLPGAIPSVLQDLLV
ncbi:MAG: NAD(P)H-hydrate dehydratase [Alphaproteobacteria bacterium]|nr:NAD(P)H-hydrate dehydratase [Alphaproteobacteria bacterium]